ncbi:Transmembrane protein [Phytophthora megakarya]|uniref:Transmembrane protein n=1 Tax=Phytophthora megakarya TaxID=4795 RepID=A0A225WR14_9STRA|nr:Transmembrane protein [Phytophthora megakarya]
MATPFLLVFKFSSLDEDGEAQTKIYYSLTAVGIAISLVEWYISLPSSRYSWIVGNTLFGIVALGAMPLFFSMQPRTARSQYDDLVMEQEQEQDKIHRVPEEEDPDRVERLRSREMEMQRQGQPGMTRLLYGCGFCVLSLWLIMFSSYSARGEASTRSWFLLYLLSPVLCIVLFCSRVARVRFSFEHAVAYSTLIVHIPLFLGHLCVRLFALAEDPAASSSTSTESWLKLAISVLYLLMMQGYFFVITYMVNSMSEPFAHPSLLYVGQLYYYVFWYILVGSDTPIDALYWGMLLLNNIHIAFLNTGVYTDFKRTSSAWLAIPLQVNITSSVAFCLRTTTSAMDVTRCLPRRKSVGRQGLIGLNCGVAGAAAMEAESDLLEDGDHDCRYDSGYGSDGFIVTRNMDEKEATVGEMPSWQETGSRNRERDRSVNSVRRDTQTSAVEISPSRKTSAWRASSIRDTCSRAHMNCKKCTTSDTLKPLYFLMKLAEQDNMADTTALILVPSLLTLLAVFEKPGNALAVLQDQTNLWLRCVCMFIGRLGGAFLAREIFTCKLRSRLRSSPDEDKTAQPDAITGSIDGMPARLWIQHLMLQDFHAQFWYLTAVTMVVTFGCFARIDLPLRFALL